MAPGCEGDRDSPAGRQNPPENLFRRVQHLLRVQPFEAGAFPAPVAPDVVAWDALHAGKDDPVGVVRNDPRFPVRRPEDRNDRGSDGCGDVRGGAVYPDVQRASGQQGRQFPE